ncbi:uncharacterized protein LOC132754353 [Ruditapes philippinarum]|uniref:uncharacterized protein LOC132754353 n=1 Tax=Ruditapes philippinarum TaxID=129788 RepID=UPI00295A868E|nr:uncharacterized protein LOC132754353 [Ruditapes philippinarum]
MRSDVNSLKRTAVTCEETSTSKRFCTRDDSGSDHESVGDFFTESGVTDGNDDDDDDEFCMVDFFEDASETGAAISYKLATLSNKALQVQPKEEKIKELLDTHKRPNNVEFLQVPLVNEQLWRQLPSRVKAQDFLLQRTQKIFSSALVPVLKTMDELKTDGRPKMKELIGDTFKLLNNAFVTTSQMRRDRIKKELLPLYRPICSANQSATHLFGDKVDEELKKLRDNKQQLTCTSRRFFFRETPGHGDPGTSAQTETCAQFTGQHEFQSTATTSKSQLQDKTAEKEYFPIKSTEKLISECNRQGPAKSRNRSNRTTVFSSTNMACTDMVADINTTYCCTMPSTSAPSGHPYVVPSTGKETPIKKDEASAFSLIRKALEDRGISNEAQQISLIRGGEQPGDNERLIINTPHLLKTSKPGRQQTPFLFDSFKSDKRLCIVSVISEYLQRTKDLRNTNKLLISTVKPHGAVSKQTICRWIKLIMHRAGVHKSFKPHSTRAAASSIAHMRGVPLQTIIESAGWSNAQTFAKYYDKPVSNTNGKSMQAIIDIAN